MPKRQKQTRKVLNAESGGRVRHLREALGDNQTKFAERLVRFKKSAISLWEKGREPSADAYVALGNLAPYPDCLWFYERAGLTKSRFRYLSQRILNSGGTPASAAGLLSVRAIRKTSAGDEASLAVPFPADVAPLAGQLEAYIVTEFSESSELAPGNVVIVDTSDAGPQQLAPFWDEVILVEFLPLPPTDARVPSRPYVEGIPTSGLFLGRLRLKRVFLAPQRVVDENEVFSLEWKATIGPCNDPEKLVLNRIIRVASAERHALWTEERTGVVIGSFQGALPTEGRSAWGKAEREAEAAAPLRAELAATVRILGRVVGRYWPPKEK